MRSRPVRRRPLFDLARLWIEPANKAAREIAVVNEMIRIVRKSSRAGARIGQSQLFQIERLRIDAANIIRTKLAEVSGVVWPDDDSVWQRVRRRHFFQNDLSRFRIEAADEVAVLGSKEDHPVVIEHQAVRIFCARVRHRVFGYVAGARIEFADVGFEVSGEPDITVLVRSQTMRTGVSSLEWKFFDSSRGGI